MTSHSPHPIFPILAIKGRGLILRLLKKTYLAKTPSNTYVVGSVVDTACNGS